MIRGRGIRVLFPRQVFLDRILVEFLRLAFFHGKRSARALTQTVAKPVAINLAYQARLSVDNLYCPFRA